MTKKLTVVLTSAFILLGTAAMAGGPGPGPMREEMQKHHAEMLAKYDANKDGQLDETERAKAHEEMATTRFKELDTNHDGMLSIDEFKAGKPPMGPGMMGPGMGPGMRGGHMGHDGMCPESCGCDGAAKTKDAAKK